MAVVTATVLAAAVAQAPVAAAAYPYPGVVTGDVAVHDPAVVKAVNGTYFLFSTGNGIEVRTSTDRTEFRRAGPVFPNGASWAHPFTGGGNTLWAPDVSFHNGRYYLYYSASTFGSRNSAVFLATSPTAQPGSWTNQGVVVQTSNSSDHNAIDPNLVVDQSGAWWLTYGSYWTGIKLVRINAATGGRHAVQPRHPSVEYRSGYYYLFVSFDRCCQARAARTA